MNGTKILMTVIKLHFFFENNIHYLFEFQNVIRALPLEEVVSDVLKGKWDHEKTKFSLPPLMNLVNMLTITIITIF